MKGFYTLADEYVLRTHSLSTNEVSNLNADGIKELCSSPIVSEAIYLASPELHQEMTKYLKGKKMKDENRLLQSLLKYLLRMGHRCTPFGLFSGCAVGKIGDQTKIELDTPKHHKRFTRIDMGYICSLVQQLEQTSEIRNTLNYYPNTSLYPIGNKLRYIEYRYKNTNRSHYTISIDNSEYIESILSNAKKGASIQKLAEFIVEDDISIQDATTFINQLIDNQILISDISPSVTGQNYLELLTNKIPNGNIKNRLEKIKNLLTVLDNGLYENNFEQYQKITELLDSFEITYNKKFLFQADLMISTKQNTVSGKISEDVQKGIQILNKLIPVQEDEKLTNFRKKFFARFEEEKVPLALALDVETGVGYGFNNEDDYDISPLINDLNLSSNTIRNTHKKIKWNFLDEFLNKKLINAEKDAFEIYITDEDLENFEENWQNLPVSFTAIVHLLNNNQDKPLINMSFVGGPSATYLLGRFTQADPEIEKLLQKITHKEQEQKDAVFAEIAHLPENRIGNIINRSHIRNHEIPYLTKSTLPDEQQIPIDDILVSVDRDRIVLFSKKLNTEIMPRMANAHNYSYNPLPIYQFLCDIQTQNLRDRLEFDWGNAAMGRDFLPRLRYKNIFISQAQWIIRGKEIEKLKNVKNIKTWRTEKNIPQKVTLVDSDNELLIDLDHSLSIEMFLKTIQKRNQIILKEYIFDQKDALVKESENSYNNELFFSVLKQN